MKTTFILAAAAFSATNAFDIDIEHEQELVRVKRQATEEPFECTFTDQSGVTVIWSDYNTPEECDAVKRDEFEQECLVECEEEDSPYTCSDDDIERCVNAQFMAGRSAAKRKLGVRYTRWKAVTRMIAHIVAKPNLKKKEVVKKILNYGCHCFPGSKRNRSVGGKGPAMDTIDGICRSQYQCHKCVEMEYGCSPDLNPYTVQFKGRKNALQKEVICRDDEGTCSRSICECDRNMAENLEDVWFAANIHNGFYWKDRRNAKKNPTFDYEGTCNASGLSAVPDSCCGNFPDVVPYNQASKGCCVSSEGPKLFDSMTSECCSSGEIANIGSC